MGVITVAIVATMVSAQTWSLSADRAGVVLFGALLCAVELLVIPSSGGVGGSIAFILHLTASLLFGPLVAALLTALSAAFALYVRGLSRLKVAFNVAQRVLAVLLACVAFVAVGGKLPLADPHAIASVDQVMASGFRFTVMSAVYFVVNGVLVSGAVSLSNRQRFLAVWRRQALPFLAFDVVASLLALVIATLYVRSGRGDAFSYFAMAAMLLPFVAVRQFYWMYRRQQASGEEWLKLMVKSIEARDAYTSGHSIRVSKIAGVIAGELALSASMIREIETAALLHDVGKIHEEYLPLLAKPTSLTPGERAVLETHVLRSVELVATISSFRRFVVPFVRHHHERWDGRGYPDRLSKESIPLGARIISIADTIDSMTSDRPYRRRMTFEDARRELLAMSGSQFDPVVVRAAVGSSRVRRIIADELADEGADVARFSALGV